MKNKVMPRLTGGEVWEVLRQYDISEGTRQLWRLQFHFRRGICCPILESLKKER